MRRLTAILALVIGAGVLGLFTGSAHAVAPFGPLQTCKDVDGSGAVGLSDIYKVAGGFGKAYGDPNYMYLYDTNADASVGLNDIYTVGNQFAMVCPLMETQVALATLATVPFRNCQDAIAAGYIQDTQMVPNMGIHLEMPANMIQYYNTFWSGSAANTADQLRHPLGLMCTDSNPAENIDVADKLLGMWYSVPNDEVCSYYGIPAGNCSSTEPVGFGTTNTDEDNIDLDPGPYGLRRTFHVHDGLCIGSVGQTAAFAADTFGTGSQTTCLSGGYGPCGVSGCIWFNTYRWMVHLYSFTPNEKGRFQMWSGLVPYLDGGGGGGMGAGMSEQLVCGF